MYFLYFRKLPVLTNRIIKPVLFPYMLPLSAASDTAASTFDKDGNFRLISSKNIFPFFIGLIGCP